MATEIQKAKEEALTRKLRRSITGVESILGLAKTNGGDIKGACKKLGRNPGYVDVAMFFLKAAEKKNKMRLPAVEKLENEWKAIKNGTGVKEEGARGTQIENAIAGMKHAVSNRVSMADAGTAIGKSTSYLSMCVATVGDMNATRSQKEELSNLHSQYLRLVADDAIKTGKKATTKAPKTKTPARKRYTRVLHNFSFDKQRSGKSNAMSHLTGQNVEFEYPIITGRKIAKVVEKFPLPVMKVDDAFAVPARKNKIREAAKAVASFMRRNPKTQFLQQREGNEFVTYRLA